MATSSLRRPDRRPARPVRPAAVATPPAAVRDPGAPGPTLCDACREAIPDPADASRTGGVVDLARRVSPRAAAARAAVVRALLLGEAPERGSAAATALELGLVAAGPVRVAVLHLVPDDGSVPDDAAAGAAALLDVTWRIAARTSAGTGDAVTIDGVGVMLLPSSAGDAAPARLPAIAAEELARAGLTAVIGVGDVQPDLADAHRSHRLAEQAARVAVAEGRSTVAAEDLGAYRALFAMPDPTDAAAIDPRVAALCRTGEVVLAQTVETYLDLGCSAARTAERLHVHRGTLYYRLRRFAELTGCDLDDGADRLLVHLALKAARLADG